MNEIISFLLNVLPKDIKDALFLGLVGLAVILVEKTFVFLNNYIKNFEFSKNQGFTISGTWLADFSSFISGKHNIELVRISQEQEKIRLYIEHYNNLEKNNFLKIEGSGVFRASKMSAVYYPLDTDDSRSGVFSMRTVTTPNGEVLKGKYAEFESTEKGDILHNNENYTLTRIYLPLKKRIKMKFNIPCFKNYYDLEFFLQKKYLFNWDKIPGEDSGMLIKFLTKKFGVDWIETANLEKIDDGKTIKLSAGTRHLLLERNYEKTKVIMKIDDGRIDELIAEPENSNIYQRINETRKTT